MRVRFGKGDRSAGAAGSWPAGNQTVDLHVGGRLHHHSTIARSDS